MTGSPAAMYSRTAFGSPSAREGKTAMHRKRVFLECQSGAKKQKIRHNSQISSLPLEAGSLLAIADQYISRVRELFTHGRSRRDEPRMAFNVGMHVSDKHNQLPVSQHLEKGEYDRCGPI